MQKDELLDITFREFARIANVEPDVLRGDGRKDELVSLRQIFCLIAYKKGYTSPTAIGRVIHRDHATVWYSLREAENRMQYDKGFKKLYAFLNVQMPDYEFIRICYYPEQDIHVVETLGTGDIVGLYDNRKLRISTFTDLMATMIEGVRVEYWDYMKRMSRVKGAKERKNERTKERKNERTKERGCERAKVRKINKL